MISEKELCSDWIHFFPALKRYKSGRKLLCRLDSVIYGIELEKVRFVDSSYRPNFISMCLLGNPTEFAVNQVLETRHVTQYEVAYSKHTEILNEAISLMRSQVPLLSKIPPYPDNIISMYREQKERQIQSGSSPLGTWVSLIQLAIFYGDIECAEKEKRDMFAFINPATLELRGEDFKSFLKSETSLKLDELKERYSNNLQKAGWDKLPVLGPE